MLLDVIIKPTLIVACTCVAMILTQCIAWTINGMFSKFLNAYTGFETLGIGMQLLWSIAYVAIMFTAFCGTYKYMMLHAPSAVITVIGGIAMSFSSAEQGVTSTNAAIGGIVGRIGAALGGLGAGLGLARGPRKPPPPKDPPKNQPKDDGSMPQIARAD